MEGQMPGMPFSMNAVNMPAAPAQGFWSNIMGALSGAGQSMKANPERTAIVLDMLGKGFDPENPFAGIGTAMGKSSLAAKAETAGQKGSSKMFQQILSALTSDKQNGPTTAAFSVGEDGKLNYKMTGMEEGMGSMEESVKEVPGFEASKPKTFEQFADKYSE